MMSRLKDAHLSRLRARISKRWEKTPPDEKKNVWMTKNYLQVLGMIFDKIFPFNLYLAATCKKGIWLGCTQLSQKIMRVMLTVRLVISAKKKLTGKP